MSRNKVTYEVLELAERNMRMLYDKHSTGYDLTDEEKIKAGDIADQIAQLRFPIKINEVKE